MNEDAISRRDALRRLASLPIDYCYLSLFMPVLSRPTDEILIQCAAGITACWYLHKGKDLAFVFDTVSRYIPTLQEIVATGSTTQRKDAAELLAQCFLLQSQLVNHFGDHPASLSYAKQAEQYSGSEAADNVVLEILAVRAQANAYNYAHRWEQALQVAKKAKYLLKMNEETSKTNKETPIPPLAASWVYACLANCQGHNGLKQDAKYSLGLAHTQLLAQRSKGPAPIWIPHDQGNLLLNDGLAHLHLGLYKEARDSFEQAVAVQATSETARIEALISQVKAELHREDVLRDMNYCIDRFKQGIQGAISVQSEQWFNTATNVFIAMRAAWPAEQRIKNLREHIVHW